MRKYYYGAKRHGPYFEGWYIKLSTKSGDSLALIPAIHIDRTGKRNASMQIITRDAAWWLEYPEAEFSACENQLQICLGQTICTDKGLIVNIERRNLSLHGSITFGPLLPLQSDIMGPFRFLPKMECAHSVISMAHPLTGKLILNGNTIDFSGGVGYMESDRGSSFPSAYLWTQCTWRESQRNSLMLSVATIPLPVGHFTGCICAIIYHGQEYRLATYQGAKIEQWGMDKVVIRQGPLYFVVEIAKGSGQPLRAPVAGNMERTIRENLCAKLHYSLSQGEKILFDHTDCRASFEYANKKAEIVQHHRPIFHIRPL